MADQRTETSPQSQSGVVSREAAQGNGTEAPSPQGTLGNLGVAARTGGEPAPDGAPEAGRPENPTTTEVQTALNATPFVATAVLDQIARLARQHSSWPADCYGNATVMALMNTKFTGDQMYRALVSLNQPAGDGRANQWLTHVRTASAVAVASAPSVQAIVAGATPAGLDLVLADVTNLAWLRQRAQIEPFSIFRHRQAALNAATATSAEFVAWMAGQSAPAQVLRAVTGAAAPVRPLLAATLDGVAAGGWGWLSGISGTDLTPDQRTALGALRAATTNAGAQTAIDTLSGTAGPAAPTLGLRAELTRLQTAGNANPAPVLAAIQIASRADRLAIFDTALVGWVFTVCPGNPLLIWNVAPGDRLHFLRKTPFMRQCLTRLPFSECLPLLADRASIAQVGPLLDAVAADFTTWIAALPPKTQLSAEEEMSLRALRLAITHAGNQGAIWTYLDDRNSSTAHAHRSATAIPASVYTGPLARLDALLAQPTPAAREVISYCGALGPDRTTVLGDAARMTLLRTKLAGSDLHQALIALQATLPTTLDQLLLKGGVPAHLFLAAVNEAPAVARVSLPANDALVTRLRAALPGAEVAPLSLMGFGSGDIPATALDGGPYRSWVLNATEPAQLITRLFGTAARVALWVPKLDANGGFAVLLPRLPSGPALLPAERTALERVHGATTQAAIRATLRGILDATTDQVPSSGEGRDALQAELAAATPNADKVVRLAVQVTDAGQRTALQAAHRAALVRVLTASQLVRVLTAWGATFETKIDWVADYVNPPAAVLEALLQGSTAAQQAALLDTPRLVTKLMEANRLGPVETLPSLRTGHSGVAGKAQFWRWVKFRQPSIDVLRLLGTIAPPAQIAPAMAALKTTTGGLWPLDNLPRGTGLTQEYRRYCDLVFDNCNDLEARHKLFVTRFGVTPDAAWSNGTAAAGSLVALYHEMSQLPIAHTANDPANLQRISHRSGAGGSYSESTQTANVGDNLTTNKTLYAGTPQAYTERYFDHTVRHEIGHSVDALLGGRTDLVYTTAGWQEFASTEFDAWATAMNAWDPQGGAAPSAADQAAIKAVILEYLQSGGGTIAGPSQPIGSLVGPTHPFTRFAHVKIVQQMTAATPGLGYIQRFDDGTSIWSVNFYYRRFMQCKSSAGQNVPRDYTMFAPAEWFADMYAEYYRAFDGVNDSTLGGNCPGYVTTWFTTNVHRIGGRTPSDLHGRSLPPGQRAHH